MTAAAKKPVPVDAPAEAPQKLAMVRLGTFEDLNALIGMAATFAGESTWSGVQFDYDKARRHLKLYLESPNADVLVAEVNGKIIGAVLVAASLEFHVLPFCYVAKFYVAPEGRRTAAGRELAEAIKRWAQANGCTHAFVTATAGLSPLEQKLFVNLMAAAGFKESGPVMALQMVEAADE